MEMQMMELFNLTIAVLQFLPNWETIQRGQIQAGKRLVIEYDMKRMPGIGRWRSMVTSRSM